MTVTEAILLRRTYELERQQPERSYARDHSFEEWVEWWSSVNGCENLDT